MSVYLAQALPFNIAVNPADIVVGLTYALQVGFILLFIGGILIVGFKKRWFTKFPTTAIIEKMWGGEPVADIDKIRRVKKKRTGELYYEFRKRPGFKWRPPSFEMIDRTINSKSVLYLKELAENEFEVVNPKAVFSVTPEQYKNVESEELDKYFKNTQDDAARQKWKQETGWKKLLDALPLIISIFGVALFFYVFGNYVAIPMINQYSGSFAQATLINNQSQALLDKAVQYTDILTRLAAQDHTTSVQYVCANHTIVLNPNLC